MQHWLWAGAGVLMAMADHVQAAEPQGVSGYLGVAWYQSLDQILTQVTHSHRVGHELLGYNAVLDHHEAWGRSYEVTFSVGPGIEIQREGLIAVTLRAPDDPVPSAGQCRALAGDIAADLAATHGPFPAVSAGSTDPHGMFTSFMTQKVFQDGSGIAVTAAFDHATQTCGHSITLSPQRVFSTAPAGGQGGDGE